MISNKQKPNWLDQGHEAVLDDITLSLGKCASTGQAVDGVQHGVNHDGPMVSTRKQRSTLGQKWQHGRTQITVECQRHLGGTERHLKPKHTETKKEIPSDMIILRNIHLSINYSAGPSGLKGSWIRSRLTSGERLGTPWARHQFIIGLIQRRTSNHTHTLMAPINKCDGMEIFTGSLFLILVL